MMNMRRVLRSPEAGEGGGTEEEMVTVSKAELEALREEARGRREAEERARGEVERVEERERRRGVEREEALRRAVKEKELAVALAGRPLVSGAAGQLLKLWADELDVYEAEGRYRVSARDGRPVSDAVAGWLSSREYAHFCVPSSKGGTAVPGQPKAAAGQAVEMKTLGDAVLQRWREASSSRGMEGGPVGLGRRR